MILNGSFVTDRREPQDVDCILVPGSAYTADSEAAFMLRVGLPYLSLEIIVTQEELDYFIREVFGSDRAGRVKGLIEVIL